MPISRQSTLTVALLSGAFFQLFHLLWHVPGCSQASIAALLVFILAALPQLKRRELILLTMASAATVAAFMAAGNPWSLLERALLQAAFLTAFMVLLALLRDGAAHSRSVLALGEYLTSRPPGRRYLALHLGGQLLGMFLNFGALTLLGPLIQRGARTGAQTNPALADWREQRQLSALIRGFSWTIAFSPASVAMAITVSVVHGANLLIVCSCGLSMVVGSLVIGWSLDRLTGRKARHSLAQGNALPIPQTAGIAFPVDAAMRLALVCSLLFAIALATMAATQAKIVVALMFASPVITLMWLWQQNGGLTGNSGVYRKQLTDIAIVSVPGGVPEAVTLAAAGYVGVIAAALINAEWFAARTGITELGEVWIYMLALAIVPVLSNFALPPILTVTFVGSLYTALPFTQLNPSLLACALAWGWGVNLTASPFGGVPLILGRITGIAGTTLAWRWNGLFSALIFVWGCLSLAALSLALK